MTEYGGYRAWKTSHYNLQTPSALGLVPWPFLPRNSADYSIFDSFDNEQIRSLKLAPCLIPCHRALNAPANTPTPWMPCWSAQSARMNGMLRPNTPKPPKR